MILDLYFLSILSLCCVLSFSFLSVLTLMEGEKRAYINYEMHDMVFNVLFILVLHQDQREDDGDLWRYSLAEF